MHSTLKRSVCSFLFGVACLNIARAEDASTRALPFDRERINRYSLDHLPRSISIRQGMDVWFGYDLPRAKLYKVWRAPPGEPGLKQTGFVMRSVGKTDFEDKSDETWTLRRGSETRPLSIRYLGCSEREGYFELRWELTQDADVMTLRQRVAMTVENPVTYKIRVESLPVGSRLQLPRPAQQGWNLVTAEGRPASSLADAQWYRLTSR